MKVKVKMRTLYAGPKGRCLPGQTIDLPVAEARQIVDRHYGWFAESAIEVTSAADKEAKTIPAEKDVPVARETKRGPGRPKKES